MTAARRLVRIGVRLLLAMVAGSLLAFVGLCVAVDWYGHQEQARSVDAIVILGARVLPDGEPGPDLLPRIEKATWLYKQGYAAFVVCAGGSAGDRMSAAAIARRAVVAGGAPAEAVLLADGSSNTREDAVRTAEVMQERGWREALLVSHPLHMLRAVVVFRRAGIQAYPSPTTTLVGEIPTRWRAFYVLREATLLVFDLIYPDGRFPGWLLRVQEWLQAAGLNEIG